MASSKGSESSDLPHQRHSSDELDAGGAPIHDSDKDATLKRTC